MSLDDIRAARRAPSTQNRYRRTWRRFVAWCVSNGYKPLPAEHLTIATYLAQFVRAPTARAQLIAICATHTDAGHPSPWRAPMVSETFAGITRLDRTTPARPAALTLDLVRRVLEVTPPRSLAAMRFRAAVALSFAAALRIGEVRNLVATDIVFPPAERNHIVVYLRYTKTGPSQRVPVVMAADAAVCPVRLLRLWLAASGVHGDRPLFPEMRDERLLPHRRFGPDRWQTALADACARAQLPAGRYTWHSFRAGLITTMARAGLPEHAIMRISRHRTHSQVRGYIRDADLFRSHPLDGLY